MENRPVFHHGPHQRRHDSRFLQPDHCFADVLRPAEKAIFGWRRLSERACDRHGKLGNPHRLHDSMEHRLFRSPDVLWRGLFGSAIRILYVFGSDLLLVYQETVVCRAAKHPPVNATWQTKPMRALPSPGKSGGIHLFRPLVFYNSPATLALRCVQIAFFFTATRLRYC